MPKKLMFTAPEKIRESAGRGEARETSEARQMLELAFEQGRGPLISVRLPVPDSFKRRFERGFLFFRFGHHSWNPVEEVDGNVVEGHGRKASEPVATSQHILAQYGIALRFPTDFPTF